jgi:hypothetical protein
MPMDVDAPVRLDLQGLEMEGIWVTIASTGLLYIVP